MSLNFCPQNWTIVSGQILILFFFFCEIWCFLSDIKTVPWTHQWPGTLHKNKNIEYVKHTIYESLSCWIMSGKKRICLFNFQKLNAVSALMEGINEAWVGARDVNTFDEIEFVNTGEIVSTGLWADANEPNHSQGDCVFLNAADGGLKLADCDNPIGFICQVWTMCLSFVLQSWSHSHGFIVT